MKTDPDARYGDSHEWARWAEDEVVCGITDHAQETLSDIVYVELPMVGDVLEAAEAFGIVESVKAASDLYAPISGEIVAVNGELEDHPELVNEACYGGGWIIAIGGANRADFDSLLDAKAYHQHVDERSE